jgi:hypothetical protein
MAVRTRPPGDPGHRPHEGLAEGFGALAAIVAGVLVLTWLIRPFDMAVADLGTVDLGDASAAL